MPITIKELKSRYSALATNFNNAKRVLNELETYVVPYRGRMFTAETSEGSVEWDKYDHYDDTAVIAAQTLSASIHGAILPKLQWFDMRFTDDSIQNNNDNSNWLADTARRVYRAIDDSNFSLEADELIIDLVGFGHGFQIHEGIGLDEINSFSMIPIKEMVFQEDEFGEIVYGFRLLTWTAVKIVTKFGIENVPEIIQKAYANNTSVDQRFEIVFAVYPRIEKNDADTTKPLAPTERPWGSLYFLLASAEMVGEESGYYEMPIYSVPWRKVSGSQLGHGPGHVCMGDIKQLNQHRLMRTRAIEKAIDPAIITTSRGLVSNLDLGPRGLTVVKKMDDVEVFESKANFQISAEEIVLLQRSIDRSFRIDQLELKDSPAMTATEVQVRYELMQRLLGPTHGRMKVNWLDKVVENVYKKELRNGRLMEMPEGLRDQNFDISIEYVGAMATAQKAQQANDIVQWAAEMAELQEFYPELKYIINDQNLGRVVARLRNIPETVINGQDEAKRDKEADEELVAQQQQALEAEQEGKAMEAQGKGQQALQEAEGV